jgi:peptidoglycan/xylan/chitin deacetylase (PgdA/CDA1 family)
MYLKIQQRNKQKFIKITTGMGILILVIIAAVVLISITIFRFYHVKQLSKSLYAGVDGQVTANDTGASDAELALYKKSSPADILQNGDSDKTQVSIVFAGLNENEKTNETVIDLLKKHNAKAVFAVPAVHARENDSVLKKILKNGNSIAGNGLSGDPQMETKELSELLNDFSLSKTTLEAETEKIVDRLYCSGTTYTASVLKAAKSSGYAEVIRPDAGDLIDFATFKDEEGVQNYVNRLSGKRILLIQLDGRVGQIEDEPTVEPATPAIDKQADLNDESSSEEEYSIDQVVLWILNALDEKQIPVVDIENMNRVTGNTYLTKLLSEEYPEKAILYRYSLTDAKIAGLAIKNIKSDSQLQKVISILQGAGADATFFVTGDTDKELIQTISDSYSLGNAGLTGRVGIDLQSAYNDIDGGNQFLKSCTTVSNTLYLVQDEAHLYNIRVACSAAGETPVLPQNPDDITPGAYYVFDASDTDGLKAFLNKASAANYKVRSLAYAVSKNGTIPDLTANEMNDLKNANNGVKASYNTQIPTTEKALSFVFGNISNSAAAIDTAQRLSAKNYSATYVASFDELRTYGSTIEELISMGEEIGLSFTPGGLYTDDFDGMASYIHDCQIYMKWRFDYEPKIVYMSKDKAVDSVLEAVSACHMTPVGNSKTVIQENTEDLTKDTLAEAVENLSDLRFTRGGMEYFNLSYYREDQGASNGDKTIIGDMVDAMICEHLDSIAFKSYTTGKIEDGSRYTLKTVSELLNSDKVYKLNPPKQTKVTMDKNVLTDMDDDEKRFKYIKDHYVGSNFVINSKKLPGFSSKEIRALDKVGRFTNDKVLFLTFDDWGTDESINKLLYVLDKYNVKATFFVLTQHVDANPNLLRSIALEGHEIASHTNTHSPLSDANKDYTKYHSLTDEEVEDMRKDLVTSYVKLNKYIGDVMVGGRKALSLNFRPPTLAVSKNGLSQVFDVGFEYSISGDVSTNDYEKENYKKYLQEMMYGSPKEEDGFKIQNGSIIVMHMSESAKCTAQVLDTMIPIWQSEGYSFARIDDYLGNPDVQKGDE